ncbi:MAG: hypothetical protein ABSA79_09480 [Candidatus Bathyarchaeia archaeon]|jgi:hypothetical protein
MTSKHRAIIFSGIDGSGKSRHANKLAEELRKSGRKVESIWMRGYGRIFFSLPVLAFCRALKITYVKTLKNGLKISLYRFHDYKPLCVLWPWVQLVDSMIFNLLLVYRPLRPSTSISILDRSAVDNLVDVIADTEKPFFPEMLEKCFINLIPNNAIVILLTVDEYTALGRKRDIANVDYLRKRSVLYHYLSCKYKWKSFETESPFFATHSKILKYVSG